MPLLNPQIKAPARIFSGAIFISFSGVWVTWAQVDPLVSGFYRVLFGTLFLGLACLANHEMRRPTIRTFWLAVLCGLCFAADLYCWHVAIIHLGPGLATILANFQVFVLSLASFLFFGQAMRWLFFVSLPLAFFGLFLIVGLNWSLHPEHYRLGVALGLAAALCYAGFLLSLRAIHQNQPDITFFYGLMLVSFCTTIFLGIWIELAGVSFAIPSAASLGALVALGLFSQTVGWTFISKSLPHVLPSVAGLLLLLQPSLAFVWDVLLFQRSTSATQWLGVGVVLTAIYLGMSSSKSST